MEMKAHVHRVGVLDLVLRLFDVLFPTGAGTTYNPYLVKAENVDCITCDGTEADASGSLAAFPREGTNPQVVVSGSAEHHVRHIVRADAGRVKMGHGEVLDRIETAHAPIIGPPPIDVEAVGL